MSREWLACRVSFYPEKVTDLFFPKEKSSQSPAGFLSNCGQTRSYLAMSSYFFPGITCPFSAESLAERPKATEIRVE